jgi:DNA-binding NarL/FixJ family response regulator
VGSTRLWERAPDAMATALARHDELVAEVVDGEGGTLLKPRGEGDSTFSVFTRASAAVRAAHRLQAAMRAEPWPVEAVIRTRIAVHTGEAVERDGDYLGPAVNRVARLRSAAKGGEIIVSEATAAIVRAALPAGCDLFEIGEVELRGVDRPETAYALVAPDLDPVERSRQESPDGRIRVAIVDDQALVRGGFAVLLRTADDIEVVGEAGDGRAAVDLVARQHPDVVLMDIRMPQMDGVEATRRITSDDRLSSTRVLILTTFDLDEYVFDALQAGASGFLLKDTLPGDLLAAVRIVAAGEALLAPSVTRRLIESFVERSSAPVAAPDGFDLLTPRETEVLQAVARGLSNTEIAAALYMSHATAKTHVSRLLTKLNARDRAQLVMLAYEAGVVAPGVP